jgi:DNA-directed RNA polymerase specialized sigma24 family protein
MRPSVRRPPVRGGALLSLPTSPAKLEEFYRDLYLPLVWRATWRHGLSKEDARDVVQEAFVVAMAKLQGEENARAWLNHVVDYLCVNYQRKARRRAQLAAKWGERGLLEGFLPSEEDFEQEIDH